MLKTQLIQIQGTLSTAHDEAVRFLEKCESGGKVNPFRNKDNQIIGYKAIPKERTFLDGSAIESCPIYVLNKVK